MITKKTKKIKPGKLKAKKYAKRLSLWPLKPEDALEAFMRISPEGIEIIKKEK